MAKKSTDRDEATQETAKGYEIPIPSKGDVFGDLEKIATAKPDDEKSENPCREVSFPLQG